MSIESDIYAALGPLVGNRVYPDSFPQRESGYLWPAIRYVFIDAIPDVTICGSGDDTQTDFRIQFDAVAKLDTERDALRIAIQAAMATFAPPAVCEFWSKEYDPEVKAYRVQLDYVLHPST